MDSFLLHAYTAKQAKLNVFNSCYFLFYYYYYYYSRPPASFHHKVVRKRKKWTSTVKGCITKPVNQPWLNS